MPVDQIINEIKEKIVKPIRLKINQKNDTTHQINHNVDKLNTNVSTVNEELSHSVLSSNILNQISKTTSYDIERIQIENNSIEREINQIKKEKEKVIYVIGY